MSTIPPQPPRPRQQIAGILITEEGGGHVVTCECGWLRYFRIRNEATEGRRTHVKKCKAHQAVADD